MKQRNGMQDKNNLKETEWITINQILLEMYDMEDVHVFTDKVLLICRMLIPYSRGYFLVLDEEGQIDDGNSSFMGMDDQICQMYMRSYYDKDYMKYTFDLSKHSITYRDTDIIEEELRRKTDFYLGFLKPNHIPYGAGILLRRHGRNIGIVNFFRSEGEGDFSDKDLYILDVLKEHISHILSRLLKQEQRPAYDKNYIIRNAAAEYALTRREQEALYYLYEGMSNAEIGDTMNISISTVKKHVFNLFQKCGAESRVHLCAIIEKGAAEKF